MSSCEKSSSWEQGLLLLTQARQCMAACGSLQESNSVSYGAAISACEKGNDWRWALEVLKAMSPRQAGAE